MMISKTEKFDWVIMGEGISSEFFLYWLAKKKTKSLKILQISSPLFQSASSKGTGLIVPFGISRGVSEFGDLLVESREFTENFIRKNCSEASTSLAVKHYGLKEDLNFLKRYPVVDTTGALNLFEEEGLLLNWSLLKKYLRQELGGISVTRIKDTVLDFHNKNGDFEITGKEGFYTSSFCFNGLGFGNSYLEKDGRGKAVAGDSCYWDCLQVLPKNCLITFKGYNAIQLENEFCFGSTTDQRGQRYQVNWQELENQYRLFSKIFSQFKFPPLEKSMSRTGFRHKLSKRRPFWSYNSGYAQINGLYKNGYILAPYLSQKLVNQIE
jgi:hypothetical protein